MERARGNGVCTRDGAGAAGKAQARSLERIREVQELKLQRQRMVTSGGPGLGYGAADDSDEDQDGDKGERMLEDQDNMRRIPTRFGSVRLVQLAGVHYLEVNLEKADESESWPQLFRLPPGCGRPSEHVNVVPSGGRPG